MRLTATLLRQHIGWHFKKHWVVQGRRKLIDRGATKVLTERGIPIYKPEEVLSTQQQLTLIEEVPDYIPKPVKLDQTHPLWHNRTCYTYRDDNVLLEGLDQAKIITKTVELQEGLPERIIAGNPPAELDKRVRKIILNAHVFDSEQQKLPKRKDPERPAWNFPRDYGITEQRKNKLIITKLLQLIELTSNPSIVKQRTVLHDLQFWYPFEKAGDLIQLQLRGDTLVTALQPLTPVSDDSTELLDLPNIHPIKHTITLNPENIYELQTIYPINKFISKSHPHTVFVHYNPTEVKNLYEEEVTNDQFLGRSLMKTFTVAATYARQTFGDNVGILPKPVTVQCVHTDGRLFHFGILQLNTLNLEEGGIKNVWYQSSQIPLFTSCTYNMGRPVLEGYNSDVVKHLIAFYNNV